MAAGDVDRGRGQIRNNCVFAFRPSLGRHHVLCGTLGTPELRVHPMKEFPVFEAVPHRSEFGADFD